MRHCYTDFALPVLDYVSTINKKEAVYEWLIPCMAGVMSYLFFNTWTSIDLFKSFLSTLVNLFAILVGFTIAAIAVFTTADISTNKVLNKLSDREINGAKIAWFRYVYLNLIYSVVAEVAMLGIAFLSILISSSWPKSAFIISPFFVFGTLHCLFLSVRNITNLYLVFFDKQK